MRGHSRVRTLFALAGIALLGWLYFAAPDRDALTAPPRSAAQTATQVRLGLVARGAPALAGLSGRVHDSSAPIAGARVCAACVHCEPTHAPPAPCTRSGQDGRYAFTELAPGGYFVHASAQGFAPRSARGGQPVILEPGHSIGDADIVLERGGAPVRGVVLDATGGPIADAQVRAIRLTPPRVSLDTRSDADGRFEFWLEPGFIELAAQAEGYARASLRSTAPSEIELRLLPGSSIEGTVVVAGTREPVAHVEVKAASHQNPQLAMARGAITDDAGRFRVDGLEPGAYALSARGDRSLGVREQLVEIGIAEQARGVVIELAQAAEVSGRVLIEGSGAPCQQGLVALGDPDPTVPLPSAEELMAIDPAAVSLTRATAPEQVADIQADGSVHFPGVPPGFYFATVGCVSHVLRSGPKLVHVGSAQVGPLTWTVSRGASLQVRVEDARGAAVADAQFFLQHPSATAQVVSAYETDAQGNCEIDGLKAGVYQLFADGEPERAVSVTLDPARTGASATLRLAGSATIFAHVRDERGQPIDGLSIRAAAHAPVLPLGQTLALPAKAALPLGQGRYRIGPIAEGSYALSVDDGVNPPPDPEQRTALQVAVDSGETANVEFVLARGAELRGVVTDDRGAPLPDIWVSVKPSLTPTSRGALHTLALAQAQQRRVLTDADGRFAIEGLAPDARFDLRALEPYGSSVVQAGVAPGTEVQLRLPQAAAISGVARDTAGQPVTRFFARAHSRDGDSQQVRSIVAADGRFSIPRVAPGAVELSLFADGGQSAVAALNLAPGEHRTGLEVQLSAEAPLEGAKSEEREVSDP